MVDLAHASYIRAWRSPNVFGTHCILPRSIGVIRSGPTRIGVEMAKTVKMRPWTATDVYKLKGLAKRKVGVTKIARALKRTAGATAVKAHQLGVSLDTRE